MVKKILLFIVFIIMTIFALLIISPIFVPKWTEGVDNHITNIVRGYYAEKENSLDVLFMGNSDTYRGITPMLLWDEYGIASYSYTSPGQRMWTAYYVLKDALKTQKPDIIFLNVDSFTFDFPSTESCYRKAFDNMPLSLNKLKAINDPVYEFSLFDKISFIFPVLRFHSRISEITKKDFNNAYGYETFAYKGLDMSTDIVPLKFSDNYMNENDVTINFPSKTKKYVDKIVKLCKEKNITLILMELPSADSWSYAKSNAMLKYAQDNNLPFIDFNLILEEIDFDWNHDSSDGGDHLNIYGAEKTTKYIGEYLNQNYKIINRKKDKKYKEWFKASKIYNNERKKLTNEI